MGTKSTKQQPPLQTAQPPQTENNESYQGAKAVPVVDVNKSTTDANQSANSNN